MESKIRKILSEAILNKINAEEATLKIKHIATQQLAEANKEIERLKEGIKYIKGELLACADMGVIAKSAHVLRYIESLDTELTQLKAEREVYIKNVDWLRTLYNNHDLDNESFDIVISKLQLFTTPKESDAVDWKKLLWNHRLDEKTSKREGSYAMGWTDCINQLIVKLNLQPI